MFFRESVFALFGPSTFLLPLIETFLRFLEGSRVGRNFGFFPSFARPSHRFGVTGMSFGSPQPTWGQSNPLRGNPIRVGVTAYFIVFFVPPLPKKKTGVVFFVPSGAGRVNLQKRTALALRGCEVDKDARSTRVLWSLKAGLRAGDGENFKSFV